MTTLYAKHYCLLISIGLLAAIDCKEKDLTLRIPSDHNRTIGQIHQSNTCYFARVSFVLVLLMLLLLLLLLSR